MECKSQFCLPPAITGGCCQPPGSKFALSNNPNLRPGSSSAPKKHPKCGQSFEFRGFPGLFSAVNKGIFGRRRGSTVLVVQRCVRAGVWVEFWGQNKWLCAIPNPAAKAGTGQACLAEPFTQVHHTRYLSWTMFHMIHLKLKRKQH